MKKGDHKFFIVVQAYDYTKYLECYLDKGKRTREEEEELITACVISLWQIHVVLNIAFLKLMKIYQ